MTQMYKFLQDMKNYIKEKINADADISKTYGIETYDAYTRFI